MISCEKQSNFDTKIYLRIYSQQTLTIIIVIHHGCTVYLGKYPHKIRLIRSLSDDHLNRSENQEEQSTGSRMRT